MSRSGGPNWKYLGIGLVLVLPMLYFLARGFEFDPRRIDTPLIGKPAPAFRLPVLGGGERGLEDRAGKPAVMNFWATWCVPCRQEHPLLQQAARVYGDRVEFTGIVYIDTEEKIRQWLGPGGSVYPILIDDRTRTAIAYGVSGVPETFFIDRDGTMIEKYNGPLPAAYLRAMLEKLAGPV